MQQNYVATYVRLRPEIHAEVQRMADERETSVAAVLRNLIKIGLDTLTKTGA
jgi:flagellar biosynthesis/type III secretory pathway M-ring protein FliF/YscJ